MYRPTAQADRGAAAAARATDRAHVFHSWSAQAHIDPLPVAGGEGVHFWDYDGNRYLDFSSQFVNLNIGHAHPRVLEAVRRELDRGSNFEYMPPEQRKRLSEFFGWFATGERSRIAGESVQVV